MTPTLKWTDALRDEVRVLWAEGDSASLIASKMNERHGFNMTRNSVISQLHMMKLRRENVAPRTPSAPRPWSTTPRAARPAKSRATGGAALLARLTSKAEALPPQPFEARPLPQDVPNPGSKFACTIADLNESRCKWPNGDPADEAFRYCGAPKDVAGGPYCRFHFRIAYTPAGQRRAMSDAQRQAILAGKRAAEKLRAAQARTAAWL